MAAKEDSAPYRFSVIGNERMRPLRLPSVMIAQEAYKKSILVYEESVFFLSDVKFH